MRTLSFTALLVVYELIADEGHSAQFIVKTTTATKILVSVVISLIKYKWFSEVKNSVHTIQNTTHRYLKTYVVTNHCELFRSLSPQSACGYPQ